MRDIGRLALLGSSNLDYLAMSLRDVAAAYDLGVDVHVPPFGQAHQELLLGRDRSHLLRFDANYVVVAVTAAEILGDAYWDPLKLRAEDRERILADRLEPLLQLVELASDRVRAPVLVLRPTVLQRSTLGLADRDREDGLGAAVAMLNTLIDARLRGRPGVHLVDMEQIVAEVGREAAAPGKYWHLGRVPFGPALNRHLAKRVLGCLLSLSGRTARLIVLDLDNTLWGGVLGEDGIDNLKIGGAAPGSAYTEFQRALKGLASRGVVLAVCSKNDEKPALAAIENHPEMVLRKADFACHRINWESKAKNVADMLRELSLGAESCCFVDDNPVERDSVRRGVPGVIVPDVPEDPSEMAAWLLDSPFVECLTLTASDMMRAEQYQARARTSQEQSGFGDVLEFYRSLGMALRFEPYGELNAARIEQLLMKTNQFNATTRRHDGAALRALVARGCEVWGVGLQDRNAKYELIGVVILDPGEAGGAGGAAAQAAHGGDRMEIDTLLLSCRVLGRTIETAVLGWISARAAALGKRRLVGVIVETERNTPVRGLYADHGFSGVGEGRFELDLRQPVRIPEYFTVLA